MTHESGHGPIDGKIWDAVLKAIVAILLAASGFVANALMDHGDRITRIEANRYTSSDGLRDHRLVMASIKALEIPPQWFRARVEKMEAKLDEIQKDLAEVRAKIR